MKKQWEKRVELFQYIYSCLIQEKTPQEIINDALCEYDFDAEYLSTVEYAANRWNEIINEITPLLSKSWNWERASFIDRAIMISAIAESRNLKIEKAIIIDQALITANQYNIDDSYKYINAILEKIL